MKWTNYDIEMLEDILNCMKQDVHYPDHIEYLEGLLEKAKQNTNRKQIFNTGGYNLGYNLDLS